MTKFLFLSLFLLGAQIAQASSLLCNDERDPAYRVRINQAAEMVRVFSNDILADIQKGKFIHDGCADATSGLVAETCEYKFRPYGSKKSLGKIVVSDSKYTRYSMNLIDRKFRGICHPVEGLVCETELGHRVKAYARNVHLAARLFDVQISLPGQAWVQVPDGTGMMVMDLPRNATSRIGFVIESAGKEVVRVQPNKENTKNMLVIGGESFEATCTVIKD